MSKLGTIFVKRRAGHLSYVDDPKVSYFYKNIDIDDSARDLSVLLSSLTSFVQIQSNLASAN